MLSSSLQRVRCLHGARTRSAAPSSQHAAGAWDSRPAVWPSSCGLATHAPSTSSITSSISSSRSRLLRAATATVQDGDGPSTSASSAPAKTPWWTKDSAPNMKDIHGIQSLIDALAEAGDKLVIVEFFAPWCNACRALYPKLVRLMEQNQDNVLFLKVNFEADRDIARTLNVKVLPYFHMYRGAEGKVDEFSCTVTKIQRFKDALEAYSGEVCSLEEPVGLQDLFPDVHPTHPTCSKSKQTAPDQPTELSKMDHWE